MPLIQSGIDFHEAPPLESFYEHELLEDYDYKNSSNFLFAKIALNFKITRVSKVYNPQLYGMYLLYKAELECDGNNDVKEVMLYHATSPENAISITYSNINWRKTLRSRFGIGACFSPFPEYANRYSGSHGAFVICKVLTKRVQRVMGVNYDLEIPVNTSYDTTLGNGRQVYVKYDDYNFYPEFIVNYSEKLSARISNTRLINV